MKCKVTRQSKKFLNSYNQSFEDIKLQADKVIEYNTFEDFMNDEQHSIFLRNLANLKLRIFGYYTFTENALSKKSKKICVFLTNGRTHKLDGTNLVTL